MHDEGELELKVSAGCSLRYIGAVFASCFIDQKCNSCLEVPAGLESAVTAVPAAVPSPVSACPQQREAPAILYCELLAQASARHNM